MKIGSGPQKPGRFVSLDALRGLAAGMVLVFHAEFNGYGTSFLKHGFLAVDLFFMLSGFVIGAAYEKKLAASDRPCRFMLKTRAIRLYPVLLLGIALGYLNALIGMSDKAGPQAPILQALFIPSLHSHFFLYPLDNVEWSLAFELVANAAHVVFLRKLSAAWIAFVVGLSGLGMVAATIHFGFFNSGWGVGNWVRGIPRVFFSYGVGLLIFRLHERGRLPKVRMPFWIIALALILSGFTPLAEGHAVQNVRDVLTVALLFPVLVIASVNVVLTGFIAQIGALAGEVSYPVYALQTPIFVWVRRAAALSGAASPLVVTLGIFGVGILSWYAYAYFDKPLRDRLAAILRARIAPIAQSAP